MKFRPLKVTLYLGLFLGCAAAEAQELRTLHVGCLMDRSGPGAFDEEFVTGLNEHGYIVGKNIGIDYRWSEGKRERLPALAADLVAHKVDIIVTQGAAATLAAKHATATIPIVMASSQDAVGDGLIESLARPGGNVTGRTVYATELTAKRLELLKETIPGLSRVGVLWNRSNPGGPAQFVEAKTAAGLLEIGINSLDVRFPDGLDDAMARAAEAGAQPILILSDSATISHRSELAAAAQRRGLATMLANNPYL